MSTFNSKGVTPVVATLMLLGIGVASTGAVVVMYQNAESNTEVETISADASNIKVESCVRNRTHVTILARNSQDSTIDLSRIAIAVEGDSRDVENSRGTVGPFDKFNITFPARRLPARPSMTVSYRSNEKKFRCFGLESGYRNFRVSFNPSVNSAMRSVAGNYSASGSGQILTGAFTGGEKLNIDFEGNAKPANLELEIEDLDYSFSERSFTSRISNGQSVQFPEREGLGDVRVNATGLSSVLEETVEGTSDSSKTVNFGFEPTGNVNVTIYGKRDGETKTASGTASENPFQRVYWTPDMKLENWEYDRRISTPKVQKSGEYTLSIPTGGCPREKKQILEWSIHTCDGGDCEQVVEDRDVGKIYGGINYDLQVEKGEKVKFEAEEWTCKDPDDYEGFESGYISLNPRGLTYNEERPSAKVELDRSSQESQDISMEFTGVESADQELTSKKFKVSGYNGAFADRGDKKKGYTFVAPEDGNYQLEIPWRIESDDTDIYDVTYHGAAEVWIWVDGEEVVNEYVNADEDNAPQVKSGTYRTETFMQQGDKVRVKVQGYNIGGVAEVDRTKQKLMNPTKNTEVSVGDSSKYVGDLGVGETGQVTLRDVSGDADTLTVDTSGGTEVDYSATWGEIYRTREAAVQLSSEKYSGSDLLDTSVNVEYYDESASAPWWGDEEDTDSSAVFSAPSAGSYVIVLPWEAGNRGTVQCYGDGSCFTSNGAGQVEVEAGGERIFYKEVHTPDEWDTKVETGVFSDTLDLSEGEKIRVTASRNATGGKASAGVRESIVVTKIDESVQASDLADGEKIKKQISLNSGNSYTVLPSDQGSSFNPFNWSISAKGKVLAESPSLSGETTIGYDGTISEGEEVSLGTVDASSIDSLTASMNPGAEVELEKIYQNIDAQNVEAGAGGDSICARSGKLTSEMRCEVDSSNYGSDSMDLSFEMDRGSVEWNLTYEARATPAEGLVQVGERTLEYPDDFDGNTGEVSLVTEGTPESSVATSPVDGIPTDASVSVEELE